MRYNTSFSDFSVRACAASPDLTFIFIVRDLFLPLEIFTQI